MPRQNRPNSTASVARKNTLQTRPRLSGRFLSGERGEDPGQSVELRVERALPAVDLVERGAADLLSAEADHFPRIVVCQRIDCRSPQAGGEHAVERGRAPARLDVPEHGEVSLIGAAGLVDEVAELVSPMVEKYALVEEVMASMEE